MAELDPVTLHATATVSSGELEAAFEGPAVFANKMLLTVTPVTGRLSFVEVAPGGAGTSFRTAVCMTISDLVAVRDLLNRMLTPESLGEISAQVTPNATKQ